MKKLLNIHARLAFVALLCSLLAVPIGLQAQDASFAKLLERAAAIGIDQSQLQELQERAENRGLSQQDLTGILEPAVALAEDNLPSEMILQKALEGLSKGVPPARMQPLLQQMNRATRQAGPIVESWVQRPEVQQMVSNRGGGMSGDQFRGEMIKATMRGLQKNIPTAEMETLLNEMSQDEISANLGASNAVAAVGVFSELPTTAEQPEVSRSFVMRSLKGGFNATELQRLPAAMQVAQQRSQLPAASVVEGVAKQMSGGIPAKQILQNLFNGNVGGGPPGGTPPGLENRQNRGNPDFRGNSGNDGNSGG